MFEMPIADPDDQPDELRFDDTDDIDALRLHSARLRREFTRWTDHFTEHGIMREEVYVPAAIQVVIAVWQDTLGQTVTPRAVEFLDNSEPDSSSISGGETEERGETEA